MNPLGITDKSYQHLINAISNYPEIEQVLVFGSRAKGNYKNGSDVDLAIKGRHCNDTIALTHIAAKVPSNVKFWSFFKINPPSHSSLFVPPYEQEFFIAAISG